MTTCGRVVAHVATAAICIGFVVLLGACGDSEGSDGSTRAPTDVVALRETPAATSGSAPTVKPAITPQVLVGSVAAPNGLNLRAGPGTDQAVLNKLVNGTGLAIVGEQGGCAWLQVRLDSNETGWVSGEFVKRSFDCGEVGTKYADVPPALASQTATPVPSATPMPVVGSVTFKGQGDDIIEIHKPSQPAVLAFQHGGQANFIVTSNDGNGNLIGLLVNTIGEYEGVRLINFLEGQQVRRLAITADGPWQIDLLDLKQAHQGQVPGRVTGKGDDVVVLGGGKADIAEVEHKGQANFIVTAYGGMFPDLLINEIGPYSGKVLLKRATVLEIVADGEWTIDVSD